MPLMCVENTKESGKNLLIDNVNLDWTFSTAYVKCKLKQKHEHWLKTHIYFVKNGTGGHDT